MLIVLCRFTLKTKILHYLNTFPIGPQDLATPVSKTPKRIRHLSVGLTAIALMYERNYL